MNIASQTDKKKMKKRTKTLKAFQQFLNANRCFWLASKKILKDAT
jgi:hypothetical protein